MHLDCIYAADGHQPEEMVPDADSGHMADSCGIALPALHIAAHSGNRCLRWIAPSALHIGADSPSARRLLTGL
jgi:hypothetical protein